MRTDWHHTDEVSREVEGWRRAVHGAFRSEQRAIDLRYAVLGALVTGIPLALGTATGHQTIGLFASLGGLNVGLGLSAGSRANRLHWGLVVLIGTSTGVALATLVGSSGWLLVMTTFTWVGAWTLVRVAGPAGILVAFINSAVFIIVAGQRLPAADAVTHTIAYAVGGVVSLAVFLVFVTPTEATQTEGSTADQDPSQRAGATIRLIRESLNSDKRPIRYSIVTGAVIAFATIIELAASLTEGYWVPLAGVAVIQPDVGSTRVRALQRTSGTMIGVALAALVVGITSNKTVLIAMVFVVAGALFALKDRGYHWLVILLTPTVIIMLAAVSSKTWALLEARVIDNALGILLVLALVELMGWISHRFRTHRTPNHPDGSGSLVR